MGCLHGVACRLIPLELAIGTACVVTLNIRVRASDERPDRVGKTQQCLRLDSVDGCHPIEVAIERHDVDDSRGLCRRHEVSLGEVDAYGFVYLEGTKEERGIERSNRRVGNDGASHTGDFFSRDLVEGLQYIDHLGDDQIGQEEFVCVGQQGGSAGGQRWGITAEVADEDAGVDECGHRRD